MANRRRLIFSSTAGATGLVIPVSFAHQGKGRDDLADYFIGNASGTEVIPQTWIDKRDGVEGRMAAKFPNFGNEDYYLYYNVPNYASADRIDTPETVFDLQWFNPEWTEGNWHTIATNARHLSFTLVPSSQGLAGNYQHVAYDPVGGSWWVIWWSMNSFFMISEVTEDGVVVDTWTLWRPRHKIDIHYHMSICIDSDGRFHVFYDTHNTQLYYRRSTNPSDPTAWDAERDVVGADGNSYHLCGVTKVGGSDRIWFFGREKHDDEINFSSTLPYIEFIYTDDTGGNPSWTVKRIAEYEVATNIDRRAYPVGIAIDPTGSTQAIHFIWEWRGGGSGEIYQDINYIRTEDGGTTWLRGDGTTQTLLANISTGTNPADAVLVESSRKARSCAIALNSSGVPYIASILTGTPDGLIIYYQNSGSWSTISVDTPAIEPEAHIRLVIDGDDDDKMAIFYCVYTGGTTNLVKMETDDGGSSWSESTVYAGQRAITNSFSIQTDSVAGRSNYLLFGSYDQFYIGAAKWPDAWTTARALEEGSGFYPDIMPLENDFGSAPGNNQRGRVGIEEGTKHSVAVGGNYGVTRQGYHNTSSKSGMSYEDRRYFFSFKEGDPSHIHDRNLQVGFGVSGANHTCRVGWHMTPSGPVDKTKFHYQVGGGGWLASTISRDSTQHNAEIIVRNDTGMSLYIDDALIATDGAATGAVHAFHMSDHSAVDSEDDWIDSIFGNFGVASHDPNEPTGISLGSEEEDSEWFQSALTPYNPAHLHTAGRPEAVHQLTSRSGVHNWASERPQAVPNMVGRSTVHSHTSSRPEAIHPLVARSLFHDQRSARPQAVPNIPPRSAVHVHVAARVASEAEAVTTAPRNMADIQVGLQGYCTLAAVQAALPHITFTATSTPSRAEVGRVIWDFFDDINSKMYVFGWDIPAASTNTTAINQLGHMNMLGAAGEIEMRTSNINAAARDETGSLWGQYSDMWDMFKKGRLNLNLDQRGTYFPTKSQKAPEFRFSPGEDTPETPPIFNDHTEF